MAKRPKAGSAKTSEHANDIECDPLSPKGLESIIARVLRGDYKTPKADRLTELSDTLQMARYSGGPFSRRRAGREATMQIQKAMGAFDSALESHFPAIRALEEWIDQPVNGLLPVSQDDLYLRAKHGIEYWKSLVKLQILRVALLEAKEALSGPGLLNFLTAAPEEDRFDRYAPRVADCFIEAVMAVNPGKSIGKASNTGPLPSFLSAIAPYVSGEIISTAAVKHRLKKVK